MNLILVRHATAQAHGLPGGDFVRTLVDKGHLQAHRVGRFLKQQNLIPDLVLSSPLSRAKETAEILHQEGCPSPTIEQWLSSGMRPEQALSELQTYSKFERIVMVGHEPDFSSLVEHLLGAAPYTIRVKKCSIISIELDRHPTLNFSIPCRFLKNLTNK